MARYAANDPGVLAAALIGYQSQRDDIQKKIDALKAQLGRGKASKAVGRPAAKPRKAHRISPEGLKRIREAQKRRWAAAKAASA